MAQHAEDDFVDYEAAPSSVSSVVPIPTVASIIGETATPAAQPTPLTTIPRGPWYAVWERHSIHEFHSELYIFAFIGLIIFAHLWGTKRNKARAKKWISVHAPVLAKEFAMVGFPGDGKSNTDRPDGLETVPLLKELGPLEYVSYASGRQNIAFVNIAIQLKRRNNPIAMAIETAVGFLWDSMPATTDTAIITIAPFDGGNGTGQSTKYDNFVFGFVNKNCVRKYREERFDMSLAKTSEGTILGLPNWSLTLSEGAELTQIVKTPELIDAVKDMGSEGFEFLLATDQPIERPTTLQECEPKKRITLRIPITDASLEQNSASTKLLGSVIRWIDHIVATAHFRPEVARKIKATRDIEIKRLKKIEEDEKATELLAKRAEEKKKERDAKLRNLSADEQKKFLEREKEKELRKTSKKMMKKA
ncbi:DUF1682-domain-containing protein [Ascobolus immersus RN42]|uniref:DUF1682-domain-containing protein n=1 Tax=Ascobolus immersus RN42 TaxID=1160509 RepID=A0A3N4I8D3_ASCIM|nr:DUF1682-domain-containing protein [Ascobolus immersus RN42]